MDTNLLLVAGVFVVLGLALVAFVARGGVRGPNSSRQALGLSAGMLFGAALGAIVWLSTGEFVFWVIFTGGGMVTGLALGSARASGTR